MKNIRDYQETMQKLYEAAMKYPDEKLAKAVGEVRDLLVEYKNIIDSYKAEWKIRLMKEDNNGISGKLFNSIDRKES